MLITELTRTISKSLRTIDPAVMFSRLRAAQLLRRNINCEKHQMRNLRYLLDRAKSTRFGEEHRFSAISSYEDYRRALPLRTLEDFEPYWSDSLRGIPDVCWPGVPEYILSSGGTTSGSGYLIPVTAEGLQTMRRSAIQAGLFYMAESGSSGVASGKHVILGGSWDGEEHPSGSKVYKLSGAGPGSIPRCIRNRMVIPSSDVASETDFDAKLDMIVEQALQHDIVQISSTPVWIMAFFRKVGRAYGLTPEETLKDVWPTLEVCMLSGASVRPYEKTFRRWLGDDVALWETYGASEGLVAVKESQDREDMLVLPDMNSFFEFIPIEEYGRDEPTRLPLWEVEKDREYVIALTNNNGLFSYVLGDTVRFSCVRPYRLVVSGRTKFYLNTVGEHITQEAIERTLLELQPGADGSVVEYTVGPGSTGFEQGVHHDWVMEFQNPPANLDAYSRDLDSALACYASDYNWCRKAGTIEPPEVHVVPLGTFSQWIELFRNNDPQTKIPKVRNDRVMIDQLMGLA